MIVRCLPSTAMPVRLPLSREERAVAARTEHDLVPGREYVVFGLSFQGGRVWVDVESDGGFLYSVPLDAFELVESSLSSLWQVYRSSLNEVRVLPPQLSSPFFHEELADRQPAAVAAFEQVRAQTLQELAKRGRAVGAP